MPLTVKVIDSAKPKEKPYKLTDTNGLYLCVAPTGLKNWRANYIMKGKQATRTYGRYPDLSLAEAQAANLAAKKSSNETRCKAPTFGKIAQQ